MAERVQLSEEMMESVTGGNITFTWRYEHGTCGLNGDYSYEFDDRGAFLGKVKECYANGMNDAQTIDALLDAGIIW